MSNPTAVGLDVPSVRSDNYQALAEVTFVLIDPTIDAKSLDLMGTYDNSFVVNITQ